MTILPKFWLVKVLTVLSAFARECGRLARCVVSTII